jgi:Spy/CpxP family protein refolding chaperone
MKTYFLLIVAIFVLSGTAAVKAQDGPPPPNGNAFSDEGPERDGPNRQRILKRVLGLNNEQMLAIRNINAEMRPKMHFAIQKVGEARGELDRAIYSDELDEAMLRERVRALVEAEGEVTRLRTMSEVAVRKVLTPEQLVKFRQLRQRFERQRGPARNRMPMRQGQPLRRDKPDSPPPAVIQNRL